MRRVRSWPSALAARPIPVVGAIVLVSAAVAAWFTHQMVQFEPDEIGYTKIAIQIGDLLQPFSTTTLGRDRINQLYPLIISPLYQAFGNLRATQAAHLLNPLIVTSAAIPAYLLARRVLQGSRWWSYLIAALVAMTPWLTMSAVQLTEVAAFPASVWAMWAMQRGLDEPSPWRDVIAFAVIGVATFGRLQLIILAPVYVAVVVLHEVLFDRRLAWRRLRALHWPVLGIALFGVLVVLPLLVSGVLAKLFGFYGNTLSADHFPPGIWDLARTNFVFMAFGIGLLPAAAAIGLFVDQVIRPRDRGLHAFALLSALTVAGLIVQVSSVNVTFNFSVVQERYTMFVAPVLLIAGFALWLRGARPGLMTLVGAVPLVVLVATTSYSTARDSFWYLVSPGLTTFYDVVGPRLSDVPGAGGASQTALLAIVLGGLAVLVWLALRDDRPARRARLAGALGALLLVFTVGVTVHALDRVIHGGPGGPGLGAGSLAGVDWIDRSLPAGQSATLLAPQVGQAADARLSWWTTEFFNRRIGKAYRLGFPDYTYASAKTLRVTDGGSAIGASSGPWLLTGTRGFPLSVAGRQVATSPDGKQALLRVEPGALRARWKLVGASDDGWLPRTGSARLEVFGAGAGCRRLLVTVGTPAGVPTPRTLVVAGAGGRRRIVVQPGEPRIVPVSACGSSTVRERMAVRGMGADPGGSVTMQVMRIEQQA